jgi:hypothetical protein
MPSSEEVLAIPADEMYLRKDPYEGQQVLSFEISGCTVHTKNAKIFTGERILEERRIFDYL